MDLTQLEGCLEITRPSAPKSLAQDCVSVEAEIPEVLYRSIKAFLSTHPQWDQCRVMSSALANFLFQNGCKDSSVTKRYLNDLFVRVEA